MSINTVEAYRRDLSDFLEFCTEKYGYRELADIKRNHINSYILKLREDDYTPRSVVRKIASLRGFFKWLCANEFVNSNPALTIEQPKLPKRLPKVMTVEEVTKILNADLNKTQALIVELLYGCGLRVSELVNLKLNNIDINSKYIQCYGKGSGCQKEQSDVCAGGRKPAFEKCDQ